MDKTHIPYWEGKPNVGASAAVKFGDIIVMSGTVASNERGDFIGEGDFEAQAEQCFANIRRIMGQAGATFADIVQLNTHLARAEDVAKFLELRVKYFPERGPATTTLLGQMVAPKYLIEIEAMAVLGPTRTRAP